MAHDYLCRCTLMPWAEAADIFYCLMRHEGVPKWRAKLMTWMVKLFGGRR